LIFADRHRFSIIISPTLPINPRQERSFFRTVPRTSLAFFQHILCRRVASEPAYQQLLIDAGIEPTLDSSPGKFRQSLAADIALWTPVVKALALKID